jgi:hypothetical protein
MSSRSVANTSETAGWGMLFLGHLGDLRLPSLVPIIRYPKYLSFQTNPDPSGVRQIAHHSGPGGETDSAMQGVPLLFIVYALN